jgi:hypothetical protein
VWNESKRSRRRCGMKISAAGEGVDCGMKIGVVGKGAE